MAHSDILPSDPLSIELKTNSEVQNDDDSTNFGNLLEEIKEVKSQKTNMIENARGNRVPPSSLDAERGILCALLLDPDAYDHLLLEGLRATDFLHPAHATIFLAMQKLHETQQPIHTVTVVDELLRRQKLDEIGGAGFIARLETLLPTAAHMSAYARLVRDKSTLRKLISAGTKIVENSYRQDRRASEIIDDAEKTILKIRDQSTAQGAVTIHELLQRAVKRLETIHKNESYVMGISSGFKKIDALTNGLHPGELIIIAARPSMGKTALTLNIAANVALDSRLPVAFFSLEMSAEQLAQRLLGTYACLDISNLRRGQINNSDFSKVVSASGLLGEAPMFIDETPTLSIAEMRNKCRRMVYYHDVKLVIIDYLQLMTGPENYNNKAVEIGEISRGLKSIARELKIPVIALSQLNRGVESRTDKRPMMSDLRESGAIEQDADIIAFLYREEYYNRAPLDNTSAGKAEIIIAKNRNGPTGVCEIQFFRSITRFADPDLTFGDLTSRFKH